jgi:hypothetical protein
MPRTPTTLLGLIVILTPAFLYVVITTINVYQRIKLGKDAGVSLKEILRNGSTLTTKNIWLDAALLIIFGIVILGGLIFYIYKLNNV